MRKRYSMEVVRSVGSGWSKTWKPANPAASPSVTLNTKNDIAHFFSDEATSSFVVKREKNRVIAGVYGRNEKPNTDSETLTDSIRNTAMAAGALSGFSKIQWKSLVAGLLTEPAA